MPSTSFKLIGLTILALCLSACEPNQNNTKKETQKPTPIVQTSKSLLVTGLPDFTQLVTQEGPSVVNISTTQAIHSTQLLNEYGEPINDPFAELFRHFIPQQPNESEVKSLGSGFIISADGYILTNAHVVNNAETISVRLTDKREFKATLLGADKRTDIAVLKIEAKNLPVVRIAEAAQVKQGEWVVAIGSPFGFDNSVTAGIVSAIGRNLSNEDIVPFIQTDAAINPGNSGGPLFNLRGEVIGINSQIYSRTGGYMGLSFAIPIDVAMDIYQQLREQGKVSRGRLGVQIQTLNPELAQAFNLKIAQGALIAKIETNSPAAKGGLQAGDIVTAFNDKPIIDAASLTRFVLQTPPNTRIKLTLIRQNKQQNEQKEIMVTLGELSEIAENTLAPAPDERFPMITQLGLRLSSSNRGLVVTQSTGLAAQAGIQIGDVLHNVQQITLENPAQLNQLLQQAKKQGVFRLAFLVQRKETLLFIPITLP